MSSVITVENLGKKYRIRHEGRERYVALRDVITHTATEIGAKLFRRSRLSEAEPRTPSSEDFWALKDVSFTVERGEKIGIIGPNGAGKSTLLKILSRITAPTEGRIRMRGRVASLLEVGTGFHPELTGRENIFLNGAILGMTRREIKQKFDEIVNFSEIEQFLDTPVKRYSSGMFVRLAFAVAAHLEPEVLLIDEVLAVGDTDFQKKSLNKMHEIARSGKTILFVSHNMVAVENLCSRGLLLRRGAVTCQGPMNSVIEEYMKDLQLMSSTPLSGRTDRQGDGSLIFTRVAFLDSNHKPVETFITGRDAVIALEYEARPSARSISVAVGINNSMGNRITTVNSDVSRGAFETVPQHGVFYCEIPRLPLVSGRYNVNIFCSVNGQIADWVINTAPFTIQDGDFFRTGKTLDRGQALFLVDNRWEVSEHNPEARAGTVTP